MDAAGTVVVCVGGLEDAGDIPEDNESDAEAGVGENIVDESG